MRSLKTLICTCSVSFGFLEVDRELNNNITESQQASSSRDFNNPVYFRPLPDLVTNRWQPRTQPNIEEVYERLSSGSHYTHSVSRRKSLSTRAICKASEYLSNSFALQSKISFFYNKLFKNKAANNNLLKKDSKFTFLRPFFAGESAEKNKTDSSVPSSQNEALPFSILGVQLRRIADIFEANREEVLDITSQENSIFFAVILIFGMITFRRVSGGS